MRSLKKLKYKIISNNIIGNVRSNSIKRLLYKRMKGSSIQKISKLYDKNHIIFTLQTRQY